MFRNIMALGIKILLISDSMLFWALNSDSFGTSAHGRPYNCFVGTHECLETREPVDLMTKKFRYHASNPSLHLADHGAFAAKDRESTQH
jgi:hypothetical protein